jgi:predicted  nucleic acid-binding Zn-ribbon protein
MKARSFKRTTEASFPDNDALPKKKESDKKFDKRFNDWWDEVRVNLAKLEDQVTKYISKDLQEGLEEEREERSLSISSLNDSTTQFLASLDVTVSQLDVTVGELQQSLDAVKENLYSE